MAKKSQSAPAAAAALSKNIITDGAALLAGAQPEEPNPESAGDPNEIVRVYHLNRHGGSFIHDQYRLDPGGFADVPRSVADLWLTSVGHNRTPLVGLEEVVAPSPAHAQVEQLKGEVAAKDATLADMEARLKGLADLVEKAKAAGFTA